jgi:hypothetical protein
MLLLSLHVSLATFGQPRHDACCPMLLAHFHRVAFDRHKDAGDGEPNFARPREPRPVSAPVRQVRDRDAVLGRALDALHQDVAEQRTEVIVIASTSCDAALSLDDPPLAVVARGLDVVPVLVAGMRDDRPEQGRKLGYILAKLSHSAFVSSVERTVSTKFFTPYRRT